MKENVFNLPSEKNLSKEDLVTFKGGQTHAEYCATQYAIISCNSGESSYWFNYYGCNNGTPGASYWNQAQSLQIPMNESDCNTDWYG
jgi:hypothetical protein